MTARSLRRWKRWAPLVVLVGLAGGMVAVAAASREAMGAMSASSQASTVGPLLRILGVLRRPQTAPDRKPKLFIGSSSSAGLTLVRSLQRLAIRTPWGAAVYLVPLVKTSAHGLPLNPSRGGLGMVVTPGGGLCCFTARQVEAGQEYSASDHPWSLIWVVPDGVAKISIASAATAGQPPRLLAIGRARSNVAIVRLSGVRVRQRAGDLITWYARSGAVIKRIALPQ